ncbi:hypothetical protein WG66_012973 [Moniliophthora roreri]|nr:hypothetical protein WG66_012973 [Moniliophthora roreri]
MDSEFTSWRMQNEPENRADVNQILNPTRKELMPEEINFKIWRSCKEAGA